MSGTPVTPNIVIAIDGTFASGKGTLGRKLAGHFALAYLDTGKLYRAVAIKALDAGVALDDADACAALAGTLKLADIDNPVAAAGEVRTDGFDRENNQLMLGSIRRSERTRSGGQHHRSFPAPRGAGATARLVSWDGRDRCNNR